MPRIKWGWASIVLATSTLSWAAACDPSGPEGSGSTPNQGGSSGEPGGTAPGGASGETETGGKANTSDGNGGSHAPPATGGNTAATYLPEDLELPMMSLDAVAATADGDFLVTGKMLGDVEGPGMMRITTAGEIIWARLLFEPQSGQDPKLYRSTSIGTPVVSAQGKVFVNGSTQAALPGAEKVSPAATLDSYHAEVDPESGEVLWLVETGDDFGIGSAAIVDADESGNVYLSVYDYDLDRTEQPNLYYVEKLDASRASLWTVEFPSIHRVAGVRSTGELLVVHDGTLYGYSQEGILDSTLELAPEISSVVVGADDSVFALSNGFVVENGAVAPDGSRDLAYVAKIDPGSGEAIWKTSVHGAVSLFTSRDGADVYVERINDETDTLWVSLLHAGSGTVQWQSQIQASVVDSTNSFLAYVPPAGRETILVSSAKDGSPLLSWY